MTQQLRVRLDFILNESWDGESTNRPEWVHAVYAAKNVSEWIRALQYISKDKLEGVSGVFNVVVYTPNNETEVQFTKNDKGMNYALHKWER